MLCDFNSLGVAEIPTHSVAAIENTLANIQKTMQQYGINFHNFKKPLWFHINDGFPSVIACYSLIIDKLNREIINKISWGIGAPSDLKWLKLFSDKVIILESNNQAAIDQLSCLFSAIILFYLHSIYYELDSLEFLKPNKPTNPLLTEKIKIIKICQLITFYSQWPDTWKLEHSDSHQYLFYFKRFKLLTLPNRYAVMVNLNQ